MKNTESVASHLDFLSRFRGTLTSHHPFAFIDCERPEFTLAYQLQALHEMHEVHESHDLIQDPSSKSYVLTPEAVRREQLYLFENSLALQAAVQRHGFQRAGKIMHMEFDRSKTSALRARKDLRIQEIRTEADMAVFGEIQSRSFLPTDDAYREWSPFLKKMNLKNLDAAGLRFLIAFEDGNPIAVTLEVIRPGSVGIYAVATLPEHRKKGASTTLLHHTLETYPDKMIFLQVQDSSYAHRFYKTLGFRDLLVLQW